MSGKTIRDTPPRRIARVKNRQFQCQIASGRLVDGVRIIVCRRISTAC